MLIQRAHIKRRLIDMPNLQRLTQDPAPKKIGARVGDDDQTTTCSIRRAKKPEKRRRNSKLPTRAEATGLVSNNLQLRGEKEGEQQEEWCSGWMRGSSMKLCPRGLGTRAGNIVLPAPLRIWMSNRRVLRGCLKYTPYYSVLHIIMIRKLGPRYIAMKMPDRK